MKMGGEMFKNLQSGALYYPLPKSMRSKYLTKKELTSSLNLPLTPYFSAVYGAVASF